MKYIYMYRDSYYIIYLPFRINDVNRCIHVPDVASHALVPWERRTFAVVAFVEVYQGS